MNNEVVLKNLQNSYISLRYFAIKNNVLYFKDNDKVYSLPLNIVNLNNLNNNLFILKPRDIYRIIYLLELLNKDNITENDIEFIKQYTEKYLNLETIRIENNEINENEIFGLSIPIYTSYDEKFSSKPASKLITETINNYTEKRQSGKSQGQKLVLANPNFPNIEDEIHEYGAAGFAKIFLIITIVIIIGIYVAFFMLNH